MRITDVEAIILRQSKVDEGLADSSQDDLLVRVHTDEGMIGVGEVDSSPEVIRAVINAEVSWPKCQGLRRVLVGEDPLDVERLWDKMFSASMWFGRRGAGIHAISGIDLALWDIRGQATGKPVSQLLSTSVRDRVRPYASTLMPDTVVGVGEHVTAVLAGGFTAIKLGWGPLGQDPRFDVELAAAAREAAGDNVDILIDAGHGYAKDPDTAIVVAKELEQLGIYCLEEPFEPDELDAYARLADSVELPVAQGEVLTTVPEFREAIERGHLDIVQPDVTRCGGLTEAVRIAQAAREAGVFVLPHAWNSGIIKASTLHLAAVLEQEPMLEYCVAPTPINSALVDQKFPVQDGYVTVPTSPGLGVTLDEEVIDRYRVA